MQMSDRRREGWDPWVVDWVVVEVDLVEEVVVDVGVEMVVCCVARVEEVEAGVVASQELNRLRSQGLLFDEWP